MFNCRMKVDRPSDDFLSHKQWEFWYDEGRHTLWLDSYFELRKTTKRHKFVVDKKYKRTDTRVNDFTVDELPLPFDVITEAEQKFIEHMKSVEIRKWDRG